MDRSERVRRFIEDHGGTNKVATKLGYANGSFLSQMLGPNKTRNLTEKTIWKIEEAYCLPKGFFEKDNYDTKSSEMSHLELAEYLEEHSLHLSTISFALFQEFVQKHSKFGAKKEFVDELVTLLKRAQKDSLKT